MKKATSTANETYLLGDINKTFGFEWMKTKSNRSYEIPGPHPTGFIIPYVVYTAPINSDAVGLGIDPGKNFGVCLIMHRWITAIYGKVESAKEAYAVGHMMGEEYYDMGLQSAAIEGASYGDIPGQVPLSELREAFKLGLEHAGFGVEVVAPSKARKNAFGHGRVSAFEIWPEINHNAADAIGLALYSAGWRDGKAPYVQSKLPGTEP